MHEHVVEGRPGQRNEHEWRVGPTPTRHSLPRGGKAGWEQSIGGIAPNACGAAVGESIAALPLERATYIAPNNHLRPRTFRSRTVYEVSPEGEEIPVTRDRLVAELRKCGGQVEFDDRTYEVLDGHITRVLFDPEALITPIQSEEDLVARLGSPRIEKRGTLRVLHFPAWSLAVTWDPGESRLLRIVLGARGPIPGVFSAYDVLHEWLKMKWYPGPRTRDLLKRRTEALLRAFGIGSLADFEQGDFLFARRVEEFPRVAAMVGDLSEQERDDFMPSMFFPILLHHRRAVQELSRATAFDVIGGAAPVLALKIVQRTETRLWGAVAEEDAILMEMISPEDRRIPETEMTTRWGFPEADLDEVICDEW